MPRIKPHIFQRVYVRHHCSQCGSRCFPFDKFEVETESPVEGVKKPHIMLKTYNARNREERRAWCWACSGWTLQRRVQEDEMLQMYLDRDGVEYRNKKALRITGPVNKRREKHAAAS